MVERDHFLRAREKIYQLNKEVETTVNKTKGSLDEFIKKTTQLLVDMVALDTRPAPVIEGTGFKRLLNYLEPGYKVPSAVHIVTCLQTRYSEVKSIIERKLEEASYVALTPDIWTSLATQSYVSGTVYFITDDWELHACVLQI